MMYEVKKETIEDAYNPFDIVTDKDSNVGFITEVSINECQPFPHQISYSVSWLVGKQLKCAWWEHSELTTHCNIFVKIAEESCHPSGNSDRYVKKLFKNWR